MNDCLIIGGGAIGLSIAYELARRGRRVALIDRSELGREASWAGAGMLPPANPRTARTAHDQLQALGGELHARWAEELRALTGIDAGYRRCGGIELARTQPDADALSRQAAEWQAQAIACEPLDAADLARLEPALCPAADAPILAAYRLRDQAQIRNPRYLKALVAACHRLGVEVHAGVECTALQISGNRVAGATTNDGTLFAASYCIASGAWSGGLLRPFGVRVGVKPVRGQIVLFRAAAPPLSHVVCEGARYLVPRDDGRLLVGSTMEDVGFDTRNTTTAVQGLIDFAKSLVPSLANATVERTWAGLRPGTTDGLPLIGPVPGMTNAFCAAGHLRGGLLLAPATAVVVGQMICGETPTIDVSAMRLDRD
ncbi:MAG: glycine oxidase ThiO [Planctomycetota bacterium]|nr:MAG: glycine oxidase ThiO [Planctomycetota bacterium]